MKNLPSVEALEGAHDFPGPYTIKVIGRAHAGFSDAACYAAREVLGLEASVEAALRLSAHGRHACVTLTLQVESAEQVRSVYLQLAELQGLRMMF